MSLRAILWAMDDARIDDVPAGAFRVLLILADHAHEDGTAAYPGVEKLARRSRMTARSVRRHLVALEDAGLIRPGDGRHVAHLDPRYRPAVWDLCLAPQPVDNPVGRGDAAVTPGDSGVTESTPRGDRTSPPGVTVAVHRTVQEPSLEPPNGGGGAEHARPVDNHPHEPNARRALAALLAPWALDDDDLEYAVRIAYKAGRGDPWDGYRLIKADSGNLDTARDVLAVLSHRFAA